MVDVLKDLSSESLAEAIEWNLFGLYATFGRIPNARVDHHPNVMRVRTGLHHELVNGIFLAQLSTDDIVMSIPPDLEDFRTRSLPLFWSPLPSPSPPELGNDCENMCLILAVIVTGSVV